MSLIISGVIDGPLSGGVPKAIELYVVEDIVDLSIFGIGSANNGGGTDGEEFTFPSVGATAGSYIYVASEDTGFNSYFGFDPDFTSGALSINGDDAIELFRNGVVYDVFGEIDVDGTGQPWEHTDGWAYSNDNRAPSTSFNVAEWTFSGPNALDNETTNATASTPFPTASFAATPVVADFTLELLHIADQEASTGAILDAPALSAVVAALKAQDIGDDGLVDNTLFLSSGDAIIPGVFFDASAAAFGAPGVADIQIQNELGIQAIAIGNHEFDFGPEVLAELISGRAYEDVEDADGNRIGFEDAGALGAIFGADFQGALFPYLSTNLDFSTNEYLAPLEVAGGGAPLPNTVTSSVVTEVNGEKIGVVGATTPTLASISSPGTVGVFPQPFDSTPTDAQLDALAAEIQIEVDALLAANADMDKVVLLAHMQQIDIEFALAERLVNVDVIVAGGSNTRLFDDNDRIRDGDTDQGQYPQFITNAGGATTAVVNTDGSYKYVGRLVIDFDADGNIIPGSYDPTVSGAYATDAQGVADLGAQSLVDPEIQAIVDAIEEQIILAESNVFGVSDVFLNGNRSGGPTDGVRTQETNLGNLTADANLAEAKKSDADVVLSLKNGGGIRASIGETVVLPGDTEATRLPNPELVDGDGDVFKPAGGVSQNDIQTTLAFNNGLVVLTLTTEEIVALLEHGVGAIPGVSGRFPQVAGVEFSYDPDLPAGDRIQSAEIVDGSGASIAELVRNGEIVDNGGALFKLVTLDFLAAPRFDDSGNFIGGGDGYPWPNTNTDPAVGEVGPDAARVNLTVLEQDGVQTGAATFADDGTEQDALAEYLNDFFNPANGGVAYAVEDVAESGDERIQNLNERDDTVLPAEVVNGSDGDDALEASLAKEIFNLGDGDDEVSGAPEELDGDVLDGFGDGDKIIFEGVSFKSSDIDVTQGSAILGVDTDGDGVADTTVTLEGDFEGVSFAASGVAGGTVVTSYTAPDPANVLKSAVAGAIGLNGAEIAAFDADAKRAFVTSENGLQVVDAADLSSLSVIATLDPAALGFDASEITSVAAKNGVVAVARPDPTGLIDGENDPFFGAGQVLYYDADTLGFLGVSQVGPLPDMLTFSDDGAYLLVANEGQSSGEENEPDATQNPNGSVSVIAINPANLTLSTVTTLDFTDASLTAEALTDKGVRINPNAPSPAADIEPEYITIEGAKAFITLQENNAVAVIEDIANPTPFTIDDIQPLGTQDFSKTLFDPSNEDGGINLQNAPVQGLRMPDAVASYTVGGQTYYITANEGDGRDVDESRGDDLVDGDLSNGEVDATAFDQATLDALADDADLGRLKFSNVDGDTDGDGLIEELTAFGARSFTIFDENGNVVFDSGDDFATITSSVVPELFNSNGDAGSFDSRSDDKGSEPEAVEIGEVDGLIYAFIALERVGGVMVYDVTDPANSSFEQYIRVDGDVGPEGLEFIPAEDSPTGVALLQVTSEVSETLTYISLEPRLTEISAIQGETDFTDFVADTGGFPVVGVDDRSPLEDQVVTIRAIVTADMQNGAAGPEGSDLNGFFVMEELEDQDGNPFTSEGLFINEGDAPGDLITDVNVGDLVEITGTVDEFFGNTELDATSVTVVSSGNPVPNAAVIDMDAIGVMLDDDGGYVADFEAFEGMLVTIPEALSVTEMFNLDRFGEYRVSADGRPAQFTQNNDPDEAGFDLHLQDVAKRSIVFDDGATVQNPDQLEIIDGGNGVLDADDSFRMGDTISDATGVVNYSFDEFRLQDPTGDYSQENPRPETPADVGGNLKVASFNVLNFFTTIDDGSTDTAIGLEPRGADDLTRFGGDAPAGTDPNAEFNRQLEKLLDAVEAIDADILGLVELENDFAPDSDGNAIKFLVEALNDRLGAGTYDYVDPGAQFVGTDAISTGLIFKPAKVAQKGEAAFLVFEEASAATTFETASALNDFVSSDDEVGNFARNRPAVAATFEDANGAPITVAVNHFKSKGDSNLEDTFLDAQRNGAPQSDIDALLADPNYDQGDGAGFWNQVREDAAQELADWLATDPTGAGSENVLIVGDLNAYAQEGPLKILADAGYIDIARDTFGEDARSFVFDGQTGTLDYALANAALFEKLTGVDEWHINADEADAIDYNLDFGRDPALFNGDTPARNSDHDPVIVGFQTQPTIFGIAAGNENFDILEAALLATGLDETLDDRKADFTVFAPTDAAFTLLAQDLGVDTDGLDEAGVAGAIIDALTALAGSTEGGIELLSQVLLYHVSPGAKTVAEIKAAGTVDTAQGGDIGVSGDTLIDKDPDIADPSFVDGLTDIEAVNGAIQVIDRVLLPIDAPAPKPDANAHVEFDFARKFGDKFGSKVIVAELHEGAANRQDDAYDDALLVENFDRHWPAGNRDLWGDDGVDLLDIEGGVYSGAPADEIDFVSSWEARKAGRGERLDDGDVIEQDVDAFKVRTSRETVDPMGDGDDPFGVGFSVDNDGSGVRGGYGARESGFGGGKAIEDTEFFFIDLNEETLAGVDVSFSIDVIQGPRWAQARDAETKANLEARVADVTLDFWKENPDGTFAKSESASLTVAENDIVAFESAELFDAVSIRATEGGADDWFRVESLEIGLYLEDLEEETPSFDDIVSA